MDNRFIRAEEVAAELDVSKPYAYKLIRQLNEELKASHILRPISRRYTISSAPFSTTLSGFTISTPIRQRKPETWGQRNGGRCCSGRKKNIRNLLRR